MSRPAGRHGGSLRQGKTTVLGGGIEREPLPAYQPMPSSLRIQYERCRTVQTDLAASVDAGHKAFVVKATGSAKHLVRPLQVDHPFARDCGPAPAYVCAAQGYCMSGGHAADEGCVLPFSE